MARPAKSNRTRTPVVAVPDTTRAAIYLRVSTQEQLAGYGLDAQRTKCQQMLALKEWELVDEYIDEGVSGTKGEDGRPALARLMDDVRARRVDAVIVAALDRLGRKTRIVLDLATDLDVAGAELVSCKENIDTGSPHGRFVFTLLAALAELERDTIVERTTAGRDERGKVDGDRGGRMPYGYIRTPDSVLVDENAAAIVRWIWQERAAGMTLQALAAQLNEDNVPAPRGGRWYASTIAEILKNEAAYRGNRRGASAIHWPRILDAHGQAEV